MPLTGVEEAKVTENSKQMQRCMEHTKRKKEFGKGKVEWKSQSKESCCREKEM